ncbi:hypothetical protein L9F63_006548, partial [Diploptera punctata]
IETNLAYAGLNSDHVRNLRAYERELIGSLLQLKGVTIQKHCLNLFKFCFR